MTPAAIAEAPIAGNSGASASTGALTGTAGKAGVRLNSNGGAAARLGWNAEFAKQTGSLPSLTGKTEQAGLIDSEDGTWVPGSSPALALPGSSGLSGSHGSADSLARGTGATTLRLPARWESDDAAVQLSGKDATVFVSVQQGAELIPSMEAGSQALGKPVQVPNRTAHPNSGEGDSAHVVHSEKPKNTPEVSTTGLTASLLTLTAGAMQTIPVDGMGIQAVGVTAKGTESSGSSVSIEGNAGGGTIADVLPERNSTAIFSDRTGSLGTTQNATDARSATAADHGEDAPAPDVEEAEGDATGKNVRSLSEASSGLLSRAAGDGLLHGAVSADIAVNTLDLRAGISAASLSKQTALPEPATAVIGNSVVTDTTAGVREELAGATSSIGQKALDSKSSVPAKARAGEGAPVAMAHSSSGLIASGAANLSGNAMSVSTVLHAGAVQGSAEASRDPFQADPFRVMDEMTLPVAAGGGERAATGTSINTSSELQVGYHDPVLGYVELRARSDGSGVHASLGAESTAAGVTLEGHLSSLAGWMNARHTPVESLAVLSPASLADSHTASFRGGQGADAGADGMAGGHGAGAQTAGGSGENGSGGRGDAAVGHKQGLPDAESGARSGVNAVPVVTPQQAARLPVAVGLPSGSSISVLA